MQQGMTVDVPGLGPVEIPPGVDLDKPEERAKFEAAIQEQLNAQQREQNTFGSRVWEGVKSFAGGLPTMAGAILGLPQAQAQVVEGFKGLGKEAVSGHPLKAAVRLVGGNPEAMYADYQADNYPALAGDVAVPAALLAGPKVLPKVAGAIPAGTLRAAARGTGAALEALDAGKTPYSLTPAGLIGGAVGYGTHSGMDAAMAAGGVYAAQKAAGVVGRGLQALGKEPAVLEPTPAIGTGVPTPKVEPPAGFSPPTPGAVRLAKPVDPVKLWSQEAKNMNIAEKVRAQQAAAAEIENVKAGMDAGPTSITETTSAPGQSMRTTYRTPENAPITDEPRFSNEDILNMLSEGKGKVQLNAPRVPEMAKPVIAEPDITAPPPVDPGYMDAIAAETGPPPPPSIGQLSEGNVPVGELPQSMSKLARHSPTEGLSIPESAGIGGEGNRIIDINPEVAKPMLTERASRYMQHYGNEVKNSIARRMLEEGFDEATIARVLRLGKE